MVFGGEGVVDVGVDVVQSEGNELASAPKDLPEERLGVERVGESDREQPEADVPVATGLVESEKWAACPVGG